MHIKLCKQRVCELKSVNSNVRMAANPRAVQEMSNRLTLITCKLQHLCITAVLHHSAVALELLPHRLDYLLEIEFFGEPFASGDTLLSTTRKHPNVHTGTQLLRQCLRDSKGLSAWILELGLVKVCVSCCDIISGQLSNPLQRLLELLVTPTPAGRS